MKYKSSLVKRPHEIKLEELQKWLLNSRLMYASSSMENKQLFRDMNGCFELHHGGEIKKQKNETTTFNFDGVKINQETPDSLTDKTNLK